MLMQRVLVYITLGSPLLLQFKIFITFVCVWLSARCTPPQNIHTSANDDISVYPTQQMFSLRSPVLQVSKIVSKWITTTTCILLETVFDSLIHKTHVFWEQGWRNVFHWLNANDRYDFSFGLVSTPHCSIGIVMAKKLEQMSECNLLERVCPSTIG